MKSFKTKISCKNVGIVSCVSFFGKEFPYSYGNYFGMDLNVGSIPEDMMVKMGRYTSSCFSVCNFNYENYKEACRRFLKDDTADVIIFKPDDLDWVVIGIADKRIPQKWYKMWSEDQGYCNGGLHGENYEEVSNILGERFGGIKV